MEEISGYNIVEKIGEGGMATVYKAIQTSLNRPVAIKILAKKLADHPLLLERFNRESVIIANLTNPHIIHVIDRGVTNSGMPYFVMEYIEGTDLAFIY
jgi:serine/threonine protein kinase